MSQHTEALAWARSHLGEREHDAKEKRRQRAREYYQRNRDKVRANVKAYQEANREAVLTKKRERWAATREVASTRRKAAYEERPEVYRERTRRWREQNRDRHSAYSRGWREQNLERAREADRAKKRANPERVREQNARRRARLLAARVEAVDYAALYERDGGLCHICGDHVDRSVLHFDHVIPLARGGEHSAANVRVSHARCNLKKAAKMPVGAGQ